MSGEGLGSADAHFSLLGWLLEISTSLDRLPAHFSSVAVWEVPSHPWVLSSLMLTGLRPARAYFG